MKRKKQNIFYTLLCIILGIGIIGGTAAVANKLSDEEYKKVNLSYKNGNINEYGAFFEDENAIYSEDFECQGLIITPKFDSKVNYTVYFYDKDGAFISKTENMSETVKEIAPLNATKARIVLTFDDSVENKDKKISFTEKLDMQNDIEVKVLKDQDIEVQEESAS